MPRFGESRQAFLKSLDDRYGSLPLPGGGPVGSEGLDPFEAIARVALALVTDARTASAALAALRDAGLLEPAALASASPLEVDDLFQHARLRLAGKSLRPLQRISRWIVERELDAERLRNFSTDAIREAWRGLSGIGPGTVDALLLFALGRVAYPVDRASYRILVRHGWLDPSSDYDEARSVLEGIAPDDPETLAQVSLAFEKLGREACKLGTPRCDRCPLQSLLPENGPVDVS